MYWWQGWNGAWHDQEPFHSGCSRQTKRKYNKQRREDKSSCPCANVLSPHVGGDLTYIYTYTYMKNAVLLQPLGSFECVICFLCGKDRILPFSLFFIFSFGWHVMTTIWFFNQLGRVKNNNVRGFGAIFSFGCGAWHIFLFFLLFFCSKRLRYKRISLKKKKIGISIEFP